MSLRVERVFVTILLFSIWLGVCTSFESSSDSVIVIELDGACMHPTRWLISPEWYQFFMIMVIALVGILAGFSALVLYKIVKAKKKRLTVLELIGGIGRTSDEIGPEKVGFIRFRGEYWKARSDTIIKPNRRVKILAKEGPTLIVELMEEDVMAGDPEKSKPSQR